MIKIKVSRNRNIINKNESGNKSELGNFREVREFSLEDLIQSIKSGYAHSNIFEGGHRKKEHFKESWVVQLDFDEGITLEEAKNNSFFKEKAAFLYTTARHTKANHKFRVAFLLIEPLLDADRFKSLMTGLMEKFPQADVSCKDCSRMFYGNSNTEIHRFGDNYLGVSDVEMLVELGKKNSTKPKEKAQKDHSRALMTGIVQKIETNTIYSEDDVLDMLLCIGKEPGYHIWIKCIWAVRSIFDDETTFRIINLWDTDDCDGDTITRVISGYKEGEIGIDYIVKLATSKKGQAPITSKGKRTAGQVIYEDVLSPDRGYISINSNIYEYRDNYYQEISKKEIESMIARYFNTYQTSEGKCGYAKASAIADAYSTVVKLLKIGSDEVINPPGINFKNCFRALYYDSDGKPYFQTEPHSRQRICLTKSDAEYNDEIDPSDFDKALDSILSKPAQSVLLKTIAASFDHLGLRKRHSRPVKAMFLIGQGANGKDTIRSWSTSLFGPEAITSVTAQAFKENGANRFSLFPLEYSLINWPSENAPISLDNCEKLKAAITGDAINIEKKHMDLQPCNPKCIFVFNTNHYPHIAANQDALETRYAAIAFENSFKSNPRPDKPNEKQAEPRLKDDLEYISRVIVPGFYKRLEEAYIDLYHNGIDYSACNETLDKLKLNSSHIYRFMKEMGLDVSSSLEDGVSPSEAYEKYLTFCQDMDLVEKNYGGENRYHDPSEFDKVCRSSGALLKTLKKYLPSLFSGKNTCGNRRWNLAFPEIDSCVKW